MQGDFSERTRGLITGKFPEDWKIVFAALEELKKELEDADAVIPEHAPIGAPLLDHAKSLRLVQTGAGADNVQIDECTKRGIWVAHAKGVNAKAVAEHVFAFILSWVKNIIPLHDAMKRGAYDVDYVGSELSGKAIGIVGLGKIGQEVARFSHAFGMKVWGYPARPVSVTAEVQLTDLPVLLRRSEIVTLHLPLTPQTRHRIGREELALMKRDAFLINTSRGSIVDEGALIEVLEEGKIAGAALDVFESEPLPKESPLRRMPNVILTPHTAGMPDGLKFHEKRFEFFADNIKRVAEGKVPINALNQISTKVPS